MFEDKNKPFLRLRKEHEKLANELGMTADEYLAFRHEIDEAEERRLLEQEITTHTKHLSSYDISENATQLGYERHFMTQEDAEFLMKQILQYEKENSFVEVVDDESEETLQREMNIFTKTGIKFDFKNIDLSVYSVFRFMQSNYENGQTNLEPIPMLFSYNHRTKEFTALDSEESIPISW